MYIGICFARLPALSLGVAAALEPTFLAVTWMTGWLRWSR